MSPKFGQKINQLIYLFDDCTYRPGQDEGYGLLELDYKTIRLFLMGIIIKSLSSENMTQNMCQLFAYLPLIFLPDTVGKLSNFKPCSRSFQITHFEFDD